MDYETASTDAVDSVIPEEYGGMWFFRDPLNCEHLGVTLMELAPGGTGKAHDHAEEGHEEVYVVVDGELTVQLGGDGDATPETELALSDGEAVRVGAGTRRQLHNHGDGTVRVVVAGAP